MALRCDNCGSFIRHEWRLQSRDGMYICSDCMVDAIARMRAGERKLSPVDYWDYIHRILEHFGLTSEEIKEAVTAVRSLR